MAENGCWTFKRFQFLGFPSPRFTFLVAFWQSMLYIEGVDQNVQIKIFQKYFGRTFSFKNKRIPFNFYCNTFLVGINWCQKDFFL